MSGVAAGKLWLRSLRFSRMGSDKYCERDFIEQEYYQYGTTATKRYICPNAEEFIAFKELLNGNDKILDITTNFDGRDAVYSYKFVKK